MKKWFTIKRLRVAWKIIRPALGVLTIAAPGTREAKIAAVVMGVVAKSSKKNNKMAEKYKQALVAKARIEQLVKMYQAELAAGREAEAKLLGAVDFESLAEEGADGDSSGQEV
jgi:hypothetical protein